MKALKPEWALIAFLWGCYVLNHADRQVVYTLFPALQKEFGFSDAVVGLTGSLFLWVYGLSSPIAGIAGDRFSKTKLVVGSLAVWSTFTVLSGLSPNGTFLLICRALLGFSESFFMPAAYALMANAHGPATRSKAIAFFGTSQMTGVAIGGAISGQIAEHIHWRAAFWLLGAIGLIFALPLAKFLGKLPDHIKTNVHESKDSAGSASFFRLLGIPSLWIINLFVAIATFALFLVYSWLTTFIFDKFKLNLGQASFYASVLPQIGTITGLLTSGFISDRLFMRTKSARFWMLIIAAVGASPCIYLIGSRSTLAATLVAAAGFGFFAAFVSSNQAPAAFEVVPPSLRASTVGVLNLLGASVSGFAPYLGGVARNTIGVGHLMGFTAAIYASAGVILLLGTLTRLPKDQSKAHAEAAVA